MSTSPDRSTFEHAYASEAPWDIGRPQAPLAATADMVSGPLLDAGCGTGDTALFFAARGPRVTGIDFVEDAIRRARAKATERGLAAEFLIKDALTLAAWHERFVSVVDSGLFHVFSRVDRSRYIEGLSRVIEPGGRLFLMCGSAEEPREIIPRVSRQEMNEAFAEDWTFETVEPVRYELNPEFRFRDGLPATAGAKGWFAIVRRKA